MSQGFQPVVLVLVLVIVIVIVIGDIENTTSCLRKKSTEKRETLFDATCVMAFVDYDYDYEHEHEHGRRRVLGLSLACGKIAPLYESGAFEASRAQSRSKRAAP
jgi:hypothetical protein